MLEDLLMSMGLFAGVYGIQLDDHSSHQSPVIEDILPAIEEPAPGRGCEIRSLSESHYSPIRRTDFL